MKSDILNMISVRVISVSFSILALAVFKPFGLEAWQWEAYAHLLCIGLLGVIVCLVTEAILQYLVRMPVSTERGVDYIIRRNLWFQLINTPLVSFMICLYRHFLLSGRVEGNQLSWGNFFETLLIIAFCSFAIGLYWRFKYRSRYLAAELEETRLLNEQLQKIQQTALLPMGADASETQEQKGASIPPPQNVAIHLTGTTNDSITLQLSDLLYVEAVGNYVKVFHHHDGKVRTDMLRATSKQIEDDLRPYPMIVRCHRAFIVNLQQVEQIISKSGSMQLLVKYCHDHLPVSRGNVSQVKESIKKL